VSTRTLTTQAPVSRLVGDLPVEMATFYKFAPTLVRRGISSIQNVDAIDLYEEARLVDVTRRSLFEMDGFHREAFAVMDCLLARGPERMEVLSDVRRSRDAEEFCGELCCRDAQENIYQRGFLMYSEPLNGYRESEVILVWGWHSSGKLVCHNDWDVICKADMFRWNEGGGPLRFFIRPPLKMRDRHPQMAGRVNCLKRFINDVLVRHEEYEAGWFDTRREEELAVIAELVSETPRNY
jgi:hypothetical protein